MGFKPNEIREMMEETITELSSNIKNNAKVASVESDTTLVIHESMSEWLDRNYLKENLRFQRDYRAAYGVRS